MGGTYKAQKDWISALASILIILCSHFQFSSGFGLPQSPIRSSYLKLCSRERVKRFSYKIEYAAETTTVEDLWEGRLGGAGARVFFNRSREKASAQTSKPKYDNETPAMDDATTELSLESKPCRDYGPAPSTLQRPKYFAPVMNYSPQPKSVEKIQQRSRLGDVLSSFLEDVTVEKENRSQPNLFDDLKKQIFGKLQPTSAYGRPVPRRPVFYRTKIREDRPLGSANPSSFGSSAVERAKEKSLGELASGVALKTVEIATLLSKLFYDGNKKTLEQPQKEAGPSMSYLSVLSDLDQATPARKLGPAPGTPMRPKYFAPRINIPPQAKVEAPEILPESGPVPGTVIRPKYFATRVDFPPQAKAVPPRDLGPAPGTPLRPKYICTRVNHAPRAKAELPRNLGPSPSTLLRPKFFAPRVNFPPLAKACPPRPLGPAPGTPIRPKYVSERMSYPPQSKTSDITIVKIGKTKERFGLVLKTIGDVITIVRVQDYAIDGVKEELHEGDQIISLNDKTYRNDIDLINALKAMSIGEEARFLIKPGEKTAQAVKERHLQALEASKLESVGMQIFLLEEQILSIAEKINLPPSKKDEEQTLQVTKLCHELMRIDQQINTSTLNGKWRMIFKETQAKRARVMMQEQNINMHEGSVEEQTIYRVSQKPALEIPILREGSFEVKPENIETSYTGFGAERGTSECNKLVYLSEKLRIIKDLVDGGYTIFERIPQL